MKRYPHGGSGTPPRPGGSPTLQHFRGNAGPHGDQSSLHGQWLLTHRVSGHWIGCSCSTEVLGDLGGCAESNVSGVGKACWGGGTGDANVWRGSRAALRDSGWVGLSPIGVSPCPLALVHGLLAFASQGVVCAASAKRVTKAYVWAPRPCELAVTAGQAGQRWAPLPPHLKTVLCPFLGLVCGGWRRPAELLDLLADCGVRRRLLDPPDFSRVAWGRIR